MWYFTWVLGTGFAACFSIVTAMWYETKDEVLMSVPADNDIIVHSPK